MFIIKRWRRHGSCATEKRHHRCKGTEKQAQTTWKDRLFESEERNCQQTFSSKFPLRFMSLFRRLRRPTRKIYVLMSFCLLQITLQNMSLCSYVFYNSPYNLCPSVFLSLKSHPAKYVFMFLCLLQLTLHPMSFSLLFWLFV